MNLAPVKFPAAWGGFCVVVGLFVQVSAAEYFPPRGNWARRPPEQRGFDATRLQQAIAFSVANENPATKDLATDLQQTFGKREPDFKLLGPTQPRAALSGLIIHRGYVAAEWGDTTRTD